MIVSDYPEKIANAIMDHLGKGVTFINGQGGYTKEHKKIVFCVITRLELAELKQLVLEIDSSAFMTIENVHEVTGGQFRKKKPILKSTWKKFFNL